MFLNPATCQKLKYCQEKLGLSIDPPGSFLPLSLSPPSPSFASTALGFVFEVFVRWLLEEVHSYFDTPTKGLVARTYTTSSKTDASSLVLLQTNVDNHWFQAYLRDHHIYLLSPLSHRLRSHSSMLSRAAVEEALQACLDPQFGRRWYVYLTRLSVLYGCTGSDPRL